MCSQEASAAMFQEEFEEDEATAAAKQLAAVNAQLLLGSSGAAPEAGGLQLRVRPQGKAGGVPSASAGGPVNAVAAAAAASLIREFSSSAGAGRAEGLNGSSTEASALRKPSGPSGPSSTTSGGMSGYKKRAADLREDLAAEARVAADLAILSAASDGRRNDDDDSEDGGLKGRARGAGSGEEAAVWVPPADQLGDGRTAANDKFGY